MSGTNHPQSTPAADSDLSGTQEPVNGEGPDTQDLGEVAGDALGADLEDDVQPIGLIGPEWNLRKSPRGAALWRHAGVMSVTGDEKVEVLALDREASGRPFSTRDQWNIPAAGARFRVRRVKSNGRQIRFDELTQARLEGLVLDWVRVRRPRLVHVLDLDGFGPGVLLALEAAGVPTVVTLERLRELKATVDARSQEDDEASAYYARALGSARRIIVRSPAEAAAAEVCGAPREKVRVMKAGADGDVAVLRAYTSLYRLLAPQAQTKPQPEPVAS